MRCLAVRAPAKQRVAVCGYHPPGTT